MSEPLSDVGRTPQEAPLRCSAEVRDVYGRLNDDHQCSRTADRLVAGHPYCWQHADGEEVELRRRAKKERGEDTPNDYVEDPWDSLDAIRAANPCHGLEARRYRLRSWLAGVGERISPRLFHWIYRFPCSVCGRPSTSNCLITHPLSLRRMRFPVCRRAGCTKALREWEGIADARRRRAQLDWEREHPLVAAADLMAEIPPQYPSVSRATLREFLDSGEPTATVGGRVSVQSLNGSIKSLGFADHVYAEIRSGRTVLKRLEK